MNNKILFLPILISIISTLIFLVAFFIKLNVIFIILMIINFFIIFFFNYLKNKKEQNRFEISKHEEDDLLDLEINQDRLEEWTKKKTQEIQQLKENEKFRKEYIGNVAHELKTPIFNIQGYVSTLIDGAMEDPDVNIKYLERTDKNIQRLTAIVKDLDTISKLETGKIKPDFQVFDIIQVILDVIDIIEEKAKEFKITINFSYFTEEIFVYADKEKITEVLNNLVLNSIIHGRKEGKTEIIVSDFGKKIKVSVKDNGAGIEEKHLQHIFERFYRVDRSRSRERGGSGLGLAIVKHILDTHNEVIQVESKVSFGSTFWFTLKKFEKTV